jgi:hypothetical protein
MGEAANKLLMKYLNTLFVWSCPFEKSELAKVYW